MNKKGVILCGGKGTRLRPATLTTNKHLLPIVNEPMILYPLRTLKSLGITDIMLVTGGEHVGDFADFLGDGSDYGVSLTYRVQKEAGGIADALALAEDFYSGYKGHVVAILGDNIFDPSLKDLVDIRTCKEYNAYIMLKEVPDPSRYGVPVLENNTVVEVIEKPKDHVGSGYAVTGFYIYPKSIFDVIRLLSPSNRGELEITDATNVYVRAGTCSAGFFDGFWSDAGTPQSLLRTSIWANKNA